MGDSEKYYFFPPLNPQFYFPKTRFKQFVRFYKPYTIKAKLVWFVFINVPLFKELFTINELKLPMRLKEVKNRLDIKDA